MTSTFVVIELPVAEAEDLETLDIPDIDTARAHGLDGSEVLSAVTILTPSTFLFLRAWLRARVDQRKNSTVIVDGHRLEGYTAEEVAKIINNLEGKLGSTSSND